MTDVFTDLWTGWTNFVKEALGRPRNTNIKKVKQIKPPKKQEPPKRVPERAKPENMREPTPEDPVIAPVKPFKIQEDYLETPKERADRIARVEQKKTRIDPRSKLRRRFLFLNPGTENVELALKAFQQGLDLPVWAIPFRGVLTFDQKRLYFEGLPVLTLEEKRTLVKTEYFDPSGFSTIRPIYDKFKESTPTLRGPM